MKLDLSTLVPLRPYTFTPEGESIIGIPIEYRRDQCKGSPRLFRMFQSPNGLIVIGRVDKNGDLIIRKQQRSK